MKPMAPKPQRCAIYTRKSTEHNLDLAFNSLDAQREACEAYVKSQAREGWRLSRDKFDDGGLSGASLDRPALQTLLDQVRSEKIDIIVVYKVDRLTRSLADFAKPVELFDQYAVSFVSVTQSFNTTSSMGRLTLNVLLSFAQFEREVIGERVRDKIAASKRKGIWVGGPVPLGYRSVGKKLEVVREDVALVRKIFTDYLRLGSIGALAAALEEEGVRPKPRLLANGTTIAASRFMVGPLAHMLKNRIYIGEVVYRGEIHRGEHEPILDRALFEAVQEKLAEGAVLRKLRRSSSPSMLAGRIFDDRGNPMSPSHANKKGVRYRYYVSQALLQNRKAEAGSIARVSAPDVEALVAKAVTKALRNNQEMAQTSDFAPDRDLISRRVERVIVYPTELEVILRSVEADTGPDAPTCAPARLRIAFAPNLPRRKGIAHAPAEPASIDPAAREALLRAIAGARLGGCDPCRQDRIVRGHRRRRRSRRAPCPPPCAAGLPLAEDHRGDRRRRRARRPDGLAPHPGPAARLDRARANARHALTRVPQTIRPSIATDRTRLSARQIEPVSANRDSKIPDIGKTRPETGAGIGRGGGRIRMSARLRDAAPRPNARKIRTFLQRPRWTRNCETAWLGKQDSNWSMHFICIVVNR
jgi:DNA invertase Pin-like site-specific DNA recombinase